MKLVIFLILSCLALSMAMPYPYPYALPEDAYHPAPHYDAPVGRVKIQVSHFFIFLTGMALLNSI